MLGRNYSQLLAQLIGQTSWGIELPECLERFFQETGLAQSSPMDERRGGRVRIRTRALLIPEGGVPAIHRSTKPLGIYTCDFSKQGIGFLASEQFYPTETVRLLLPTFWMRLEVVRCRYMGKTCYDNGSTLLERHEPSVAAFEPLELCHN